MNLKTANTILDKAREQNIDVELYCEYSGREMYGTTTTALVVSSKEGEAFVRECARVQGKTGLRENTLGKSQLLLY